MAGLDRPRWGWHRLDRSWARRLVASAGVLPGEWVLDIGAGAGALTELLVEAGARVLAVELHRGRARALRTRFDGLPVVVVQADAADLRLPRRPFRVVANPPFAVVDPLLRRLLSKGTRMYAADLVVPRHVARRWTDLGAPGSTRWRSSFTTTVGVSVPQRAFVPPPPRGAQVLVIRRGGSDSTGRR